MTLNVLICGGGIAGPALAFWLSRAGHSVTIVERFPALRAKGAQIDIRAQGIKLIQRMGLLDAVRNKLVDEDGVAIVNERDEPQAIILANRSGHGAQSLTSEYEIMRGDLVRILYDATERNVRYMFGKSVESFEQDSHGVDVHFSDGESGRYDIVVGADGQGSRVRTAILSSDPSSQLRKLGVMMCYYIMPRDASDTTIRKSYLAAKCRMMWTRPFNEKEAQAFLFLRDSAEELSHIPRAPLEQQKEFWSTKFRDAGWQTPRLLKGMQDAEDFYCQEVVQVRVDTWSKNRVVLLGDAAHCPSPFTAMGTTGALVGAYVLAGELNKNSGDVQTAFTNYENTLRPFVNEIQRINTWFFKLAIPRSGWAIQIIHWIAGIAMWLRIPDLLARFSKEDKGGWALPEYELPDRITP